MIVKSRLDPSASSQPSINHQLGMVVSNIERRDNPQTMKQSFQSLTTSTIFINSLRPPLDNPINYQVTSTSATQDDSNPTLRLASSSATSKTIQPSHASQSVTCFPLASCNGFIKASVINNGFTLELCWLSLVKVPATTLELDQDQNSKAQHLESCFSLLNQNGCHPLFQLHFTEKITPSPSITIYELESSLVILVLTNVKGIAELELKDIDKDFQTQAEEIALESLALQIDLKFDLSEGITESEAQQCT
ncbi:hypothetical protein PPACK8108_LOCUS23232 [Phakopsora pachyrhizi]|uniref:Uncharacterized protein n=1 Tax=Phakopsora pachyrhizi TaxID=170000 RepID=A0AAV0BML0_PHAPC|nr:hypothetical protein PPACK8108_LOCUS23232 [Phakopsora pachyrhizi]